MLLLVRGSGSAEMDGQVFTDKSEKLSTARHREQDKYQALATKEIIHDPYSPAHVSGVAVDRNQSTRQHLSLVKKNRLDISPSVEV